jgi:hypothetical protein
MRYLTTALVGWALIAPQTASALDCEVPTVQEQYWWFKEQPETYILAHGSFSDLSLQETLKSTSTDDFDPLSFEIWTARFEGNLASARAFDQPFETEVTLVLPDYSHIEGAGSPTGEVNWLEGKSGLAWMEKTDTGYRIESWLCYSILEIDPSHVEPALDCLSGRNCPKPD